MSTVSKRIKKTGERKWSKQDSAEFMEHLDSRGLVVTEKKRLEELNKFVASITQGLNVSDPENAGRGVAVVWKDHLEILNDIARVVLSLGMAQRELDEAQAAFSPGDPTTHKRMKEANEAVVKVRSTLEKMADELADKEKRAQEIVRLVDPSNGKTEELLS